MASTMRPTAKSLSATIARGVGNFGFIPDVWSLGNDIIIRFGNFPFGSVSAAFSSFKNASARIWSLTDVSSQPGKSAAKTGRTREIVLMFL